MKIYEFRYWTGPYENDISFRFHLKPGEKFNGDIMNKVYHHFKTLINLQIEERNESLSTMSPEDEEFTTQFIKDEITQLNHILKEVENLCCYNKWQDFYNAEKDSVSYKINMYTMIYITSEIILGF